MTNGLHGVTAKPVWAGVTGGLWRKLCIYSPWFNPTVAWLSSACIYLLNGRCDKLLWTPGQDHPDGRCWGGVWLWKAYYIKARPGWNITSKAHSSSAADVQGSIADKCGVPLLGRILHIRRAGRGSSHSIRVELATGEQREQRAFLDEPETH